MDLFWLKIICGITILLFEDPEPSLEEHFIHRSSGWLARGQKVRSETSRISERSKPKIGQKIIELFTVSAKCQSTSVRLRKKASTFTFKSTNARWTQRRSNYTEPRTRGLAHFVEFATE